MVLSAGADEEAGELSTGLEEAGWLSTGLDDAPQAGWPYPPHSPLGVVSEGGGEDTAGVDSAGVDEAGVDSTGLLLGGEGGAVEFL